MGSYVSRRADKLSQTKLCCKDASVTSAVPSEELQTLWLLAPYWQLIPTIVLNLHIPAAAGTQMGVVGKELGSSISRRSLEVLQPHCSRTDWERHSFEKTVGKHRKEAKESKRQLRTLKPQLCLLSKEDGTFPKYLGHGVHGNSNLSGHKGNLSKL